MDLNINVFDSISRTENLTAIKYSIYFVDYENGASGNAGTTWATAKKTLSDIGSASGFSEVRVAKSPDPISIGSVAWVDQQGFVTAGDLSAHVKFLDMFNQ